MTLAIIGTGGHAKSVYDIIKNRKKIYFFDQKKKIFKISSKKFIVKNTSNLILKYKKKISGTVIAIGDNSVREKYFKILKKYNINNFS